jgi:Uma2 family endonuclease
VIVEERLRIPADVFELPAFRHWVMTSELAERYRIDFLDGTVEVDMSPEALQTHGTLKSALHVHVAQRVTELAAGQVYVDSTRLTAPAANLSCEPDVLFVSWDALKSGRARYVPSSSDQPGRLMEIEGAVDLVVEVVSDSSVGKDKKRLPPLYARAGVQELWIVDARSPVMTFDVLHLAGGRYRRAAVDSNGYRASAALAEKLRLRREPGPVPYTWQYFVDTLSQVGTT